MTLNIKPNSDKQLMAPLYHLELVWDKDISYAQAAKQTDQRAEILHKLLDASPVERHVVLYTDITNMVIGAEVLGYGTLDSVATDTRELVRGALIHGAHGMVLCHNHPGIGKPRPSQEDINFTVAIIEEAAHLGLLVLDHIVISPEGHYSIQESQGELEEMFMKAHAHRTGIDPGFLANMKKHLGNLLEGVHGKPSLIEDMPLEGNPKPQKSNASVAWTESLSYDWFNR